MKTNKNLFMKYELPLFLLLTYLLSWWSVPLMNGKVIPFGPTFAAIIVLAITAGRSGPRNLWRRVTHWRIPLIWFTAGPAIIFGYHVVGLLINLLLGAQIASPPHISSSMFLEPMFVGGLWRKSC